MNGDLVSKLDNVEFVELISMNDVVLLSETWTNEENEENDLKLRNFKKPFCKHRERKRNARRDSGGLCVFFRNSIVNGVSEIKWDFEDGMCFKLDRCFFGLERDMFFVFVYMRPDSSSRADMNVDINIFEIVEQQIAKVSELGDVICMGDFNARLTEREECLIVDRLNECTLESMNIGIYENEHVFSENDFTINDMSIKRTNSDKNVNSYGLKLLSLCYACDLAILNGRAGADKGVGNLTFCGHQGESTNEYVMCDRASLYKVCDFTIGKPNCFSDHCVVSFKLSMSCIGRVVETQGGQEETNRVYAKWSEEHSGDYASRIGSGSVEHRLGILTEILKGNRSIDTLEHAVAEVGDIIVEAGSGHMKRVARKTDNEVRGGSVTVGGGKGGKWYDLDCRKQKEKFGYKNKKYLETGDEEDRVQMCVERNIYRKMCRKKKSEYNRKKAIELVELGKADPKRFWSEIKTKNSKDEGLPDCNFYDHFRKLADKESRVGDLGREEIESEQASNKSIYIEELDEPITMKELESTIKELRRIKQQAKIKY